MHEMAMIERVLKITTQEAEKAKARKVLRIHIRMGEYSDVVPQILKEYFEIASRETIAAGAEIVLRRTPAIVRCRTCHWEGPAVHGKVVCGDCGGSNLVMISGREFIVESLEVE